MLTISMPTTAPRLFSPIELASTSVLQPNDALTLTPVSMSSETQARRPKLSLQTSNLTPTFHASSGPVDMANKLGTTTPTTFNTFNNAFDLTFRPSPVISASSPVTPKRPQQKSIHKSLSPTGTSQAPYTLSLPFGVRSILKNSPVPQYGPRCSTCSAGASPALPVPGRRAFFPALKKVTFRSNLEEEIVTREYILRHVDLSSSSEETNSSETEDSSSGSMDEAEEVKEMLSIRVDECYGRGRRKRKVRPVSETSSESIDRGRDERSRSTSARRSKRKKRRWEWTLPPVQTEPTDLKGKQVDSTAIVQDYVEGETGDGGDILPRSKDVGDDNEATRL
ncbi:hypothetical protein PV08_05764 [Exophiala spinifera]|uniref:Uncharacterized protein n=1 Tax=Exophiala spinifera TaxID=91928 RepID=A0A0D2BWP6_9EURO|nr:uncharacterized protein PV08_05764 [Exophiala spinifera]KIW15714.1 hypothetical protein PV08_05764 [Exophiala spinifera]